jgi:hypothetical protein
MNAKYCFNCQHCDTKRTKDETYRCIRWSKWVGTFHSCEDHKWKERVDHEGEPS